MIIFIFTGTNSTVKVDCETVMSDITYMAHILKVQF
jgi:hypothetical protein